MNKITASIDCIINLMKQLTTLFIISYLLLTNAQAEVIEYDFEIIIFEETSGRYANSEQWQDSLLDDTSGTEILATHSGDANDDTTQAQGKAQEQNDALAITDIEGIGLREYTEKLDKTKRYKVLVHKAWRQAGLSEQEAIDIPIDSRVADESNKSVLSTESQSAVITDNNIHGTIKVILARYLHFYTDLVYQQPREESSPLWQIEGLEPYKEYPIKFHRRMRSKELHYLDHPMIGILIKAMPVDKNEEPIEQS